MTGLALDRDRLVKLLGVLGSHYDGEIANAGRAADCLIHEAGLRWCDLILPALRLSPHPGRADQLVQQLRRESRGRHGLAIWASRRRRDVNTGWRTLQQRLERNERAPPVATTKDEDRSRARGGSIRRLV